jgi:iron(III) transport system ATP-binding protein
VALARSLVVEPKILLLDEPLSNLDAKLRERMRSELKELQRRTGITFVYVTHDQAEALALSDRIAVIHGGRLQQFGTPREVYTRPASRVVADFMGLVNLVPATVTGRNQVRLANGWILDVPVPPGMATGQRVEIAIRPENVRLRQPSSSIPSHLPGKVTESTFLGSAVEYHVALGDRTVLRVQAHPTETFAVGDTVAFAIDTGQCTVFEASAAAAGGTHS